MHTLKQRRGASGFTMLEVLISIVVIAFGLLGVAGLQAFALKNNQSASQRSIATVLATDMIDRMKTNSKGATDGFYNETSTTAVAPTEAVNCLRDAGCTGPQQLAQNDLFEWKAMVAAALPNGVGIVCLDKDLTDPSTGPAAPKCSNDGNQHVIYIWWTDDRTGSNTTGALMRFATQFQI
jgi:type IV pilus assembly protein PilV